MNKIFWHFLEVVVWAFVIVGIGGLLSIAFPKRRR